MTQIVNKRTKPAVPLLTMANDSTLSIDSEYDGLLHKVFLFEYRMTCTILTPDVTEWLAEDGINLCLVADGISGADLTEILAGAVITDLTQNIDVPARQRLFEVMEIIQISSTILQGNLMFRPKSKGGIPFTEGSGWEIIAINRSGATLMTGNLVANILIHERFAYEGGGGA